MQAWFHLTQLHTTYQAATTSMARIKVRTGTRQSKHRRELIPDGSHGGLDTLDEGLSGRHGDEVPVVVGARSEQSDKRARRERVEAVKFAQLC